MSGSHRRRGWFSSWWSWRRRPAVATDSNVSPMQRTPTNAVPTYWWGVGPTRELPTLRYAPLMTLAQSYRGNGGRWPR